MSQKKIFEKDSWNQQAILSRKVKATPVHIARRKKGIRLLESSIANYELKGKTVINVAGGNGREADMLLSRGVENVVLLDLSKESLKNISNRNCLDLVLGDAENLPFKEKCFDLGFVALAMHHMPNHQRALTELKRTAKSIIIFDIMNALMTKIFMHVGYCGNEGLNKELEINRVEANTINQVISGARIKYIFDFEYTGDSMLVFKLSQLISSAINLGIKASGGILGLAFGNLAIIQAN